MLSLVASKDKTLQDTHTQATGSNAAPTLLRSAVVYGANASGKSNLIKALQYMRGVVTESATAIQPGQAVHFDLVAGKTEVRSEEMEEHKLRFHHVTEQGKAVFDLMDESNGTRNLLFLAGPVLDILRKGLTLVIDELDTSLHTLLVRELVRELVRLFHCPEINTGGAQLIFTTRDNSPKERQQKQLECKQGRRASSAPDLLPLLPDWWRC